MNIDTSAVAKLLDRVRREVDDGVLPSAQVALAIDDEVVCFETVGAASDEDRYVVFSATKPLVAATIWTLLDEGSLDITLPVTAYIPEFGTNGKEAVTVEQVLLHTCGFPAAPLDPVVGGTSAGRTAAFGRWRLDWPAGSRFTYHPTAAHWVLAELIERITGTDFRDAVHARVTTPAGLPRLLGDVGRAAVELQAVGQPATPDELEAALGVREVDAGEVTVDFLLRFNAAEVQRVGVPGGGGVMRACDLALLYQHLLHDPHEIWSPDVLADVTTHVRNRLPDPVTGVSANRTLGLVLAGDDGHSNVRGMGRTVSPGAFGHNGAKGQIAWADPATGLSFAFCTNGLDEHLVRESRRTTALASLAGSCVAS